MTHILPTAAPAYAIKSWVDPNHLYFELAGAHGPCVLSYPRTTLGLSKALAMLFVRHEVEGHGEIVYHQTLSKTPNADGISDSQRAMARNALRKAGII